MPSNIFQELMPDVNLMHNNTVWNECIYDDKRRYVYRYFGVNKIQVMQAAKSTQDHIDSYRCPSVGEPYEYHDMWAVDLKYYGLD